MGPLVSIITVVYNGEKFIDKAISSVLNQTYKNIEYIVIDGKSTDQTLQKIEPYRSKITKIVSEKDKGIYNAMNKGINMANGEIIGILNSDDWYEPNAVEIIMKHFRENPNIDVFHGLIRNVFQGNTIAIHGISSISLSENSLPHPATFVRKDTYVKYGLYDENYRYVADYELFLRFRSRGVNFFFIEHILANFRIGGATTRSNKYLYEKFDVQYKYQCISFIKKLVLSSALFLRNVFLK